MFDCVILNGTIIDGLGASRFEADLAIRADRVVSIGSLADAPTRETIDGAGKIVAPGFIDVHNHSDGWLLREDHFLAKTSQGFTTEVLMADGISYAPVNQTTWREWFYYLRSLNGLRMEDYRGWSSLGEYMRLLDHGTVQNAATHIPYANLRAVTCGFGRGAVDDFQMRQIKADVRSGMEQGAVGLSTGLDYIVQHFSTTDELVDVCRAVAEYNGLYVTHVRYKTGLMPALREAVEIGRRSGVKVHISHLKSQSPREVESVLRYIDEVARHEVDFSFDSYPYQHGSTMLNYLLPYDVWEDGPLSVVHRLRQPDARLRFRQGLAAYRLDLEQIRIAWVKSKENACHQGKTLARYVDEIGLPAEEALFNLLLEEGLAVLCVMNEGDDQLVHPFLQHDCCIIGSDGIYHPDAVVHPRVYGTATRMLGPLVRDAQLFDLEAAVQKLSSKAAQRFGFRDRGHLAEGSFADVVVFDEAQVTDRATYESPEKLSTGIDHVFVNGERVIRDGSPAALPKQLPGRFVRADFPAR